MMPVPRRLNARIILIVSSILLLTGVSSGWLIAEHQTAGLLADMRRNATVMTEQFAESSARLILTRNYAELETFLLKSAQLPDIRRLTACEPDGTLIWDVVHAPGHPPRATTGVARITPPTSRSASSIVANGHLVIWYPVEAGSLVGWIRAEFSLASIHAAQVQVWEHTLLLAMAWVTCSAILVILVLRPLVHAISRLTTFAKELDEHKGDQISLGSQPQEIDELVASLNATSLRLLAAEEQLQKEQERLRREKSLLRCIIDSADDLIFVKDRDNVYIGCNKASEAFVGLPEQEQIGKSDFDFFDRDMAERIRAADRRVIEEGEAFRGEERVTYPDGRVVLLDTLKVPFYGLNGEALGLVGISRDITERKRAEDALHEAQQMFRYLIENSPDIIARYDRDCRRTYVNPTYLRVAGIPRDELLASAPAQLSPLPPASARILQDQLRRVLDSGISETIDLVWPKNGTTDSWYNITAFPEVDREGQIVGVMTISRDITEHKEAVAILGRLNEELEERVRQRTAELEAKNAELEKMNKLFVGRELRMMELKERIRELEDRQA